MTRGSTASIEVILEDVSSNDINKLYMTVRQKTLVLTKVSSSEGEDVLYWNEEDGLHVEIELTQEETLQFRYGVAEVQVRGVRNDGSIFASEICTIDVNRVLFDKIIEEESSSDGGNDSLNLQSKTVTPTENNQIIIPDLGYDGLSSVLIEAINSEYIGSSITRNNSTDIRVLGATLTIPSGYYADNITKSIENGVEGIPTAVKGTVDNHSIEITPSVTNVGGYVSGGTINGTAVTVDVTELESGTKNITENGTEISVSGYTSVNVDVPSDADITYYGIWHVPNIAVDTAGTQDDNWCPSGWYYGYNGELPGYGILVPGCRYTIKLPDGTTSDPIALVSNEMYDYVLGSTDLGVIYVPSQNCICTPSEIASYDVVITYIDGGSNDSLEWIKVIDDTITTEWYQSNPYNFPDSDGNGLFYTNALYCDTATFDNVGLVSYDDLVLMLDSLTNSQYAKVKIKLNNIIFYISNIYYDRYDYAFYIPNHGYTPEPIEIHIGAKRNWGTTDGNIQYRTRAKLTNIPLEVYLLPLATLFEGTFTTTNDGNTYSAILNNNVADNMLLSENSYAVTLNGIKYKLTAWYNYDNGATCLSDDDDNFCIYYEQGEPGVSTNSLHISTKTALTDATIKIEG